MAVGGSTNAVLHFLAIAHAARVEWTIDDFERMRGKVPVLCDLKPSGRFVATDLYRAGGIPQVMKLLLNRAFSDFVIIIWATHWFGSEKGFCCGRACSHVIVLTIIAICE
jgi:dihydroxyacid dehydratase/phosphogluconate dehydratase